MFTNGGKKVSLNYSPLWGLFNEVREGIFSFIKDIFIVGLCLVNLH